MNTWRRRAFTLVEVVASLMLLATLLVSILIAHRKLAHQTRRACARVAAVDVADRLLTKWVKEGRWGADSETGQCEGAENLAWRWTVRPSSQLMKLGAAVGRLEILELAATDDVPLVQLDVLTTGRRDMESSSGTSP